MTAASVKSAASTAHRTIINAVVICIGFIAAAIMGYVGVICFRVWQ